VKTLFEVITRYGNYPSFNPSVTGVTVLGQDESGAEFLAGWKTRIGKQAHAFHRCEVNGTVFGVERTYHGIDGSPTWTARSAGQGRSTLTIAGSMRVWLLRGLVMKLFLKRILYATDFRPFIEEGERRDQQAGSRAAA
jgi:Polyketide cyclase / dehydrase and lipid transport